MTVDLYLHGQSEKLASANPWGIQPQVLYHQWRTAQALKDSPLVMNVYNTGTGKTRASLLHLFAIRQHRDRHVLVIAPTNELLHQHTSDIQAFVDTYSDKLKFRVVEINAALLRKLASPDLAIVDRQGERLTHLIRNPLVYKKELGIAEDDNRPLPTIFVTNPDLFYYAFFWQFRSSDQRNLFQEFVTKFCYIVIDEFHYYNSKQLANFLFFMILSKEFGYFEAKDRRICLLSATPDSSTIKFLDQIFPNGEWKLISPDNEPTEAANLLQVPTLAPLHLHIQTGMMEEYAKSEAKTIKQWLAKGEDGALISSTLWKVNSAYAALLPHILADKMGRITGAQMVEERRKDQFKPLILATPTVDIGYNFLKHHKVRQNLDFVIFDARFRDEFVQRLGRAGRVLGKDETTTPAHAIALLDDESVQRFAPLHNRQLSRAELRHFLEQQSAIPQKRDFAAYIKAGGLLENAYPIYRAREMFAKDEETILESLFAAVRSVFAPDSSRSYKSVLWCFRRMDAINAWLSKTTNQKSGSEKGHLAGVMAEFLGWATQDVVTEDDASELLPQLEEKKYEDARQGFRVYCEMKQALHRAQFNFRDSFDGPVATIYDPQRLLSSSTVSEYDLIHIVQNYHFRLLDVELFQRLSGEAADKDAICVELQRIRSPRQMITLTWRALPKLGGRQWDETTFRRCFVSGEAVAIKGVLLATDHNGEPIPEELRAAIANQYIPALLIPAEKRGILLREIAQRPVFTRKMTVRVERQEIEFDVILGSNALLMAPILWWMFQKDQRKEETAIIC